MVSRIKLKRYIAIFSLLILIVPIFSGFAEAGIRRDSGTSSNRSSSSKSNERSDTKRTQRKAIGGGGERSSDRNRGSSRSNRKSAAQIREEKKQSFMSKIGSALKKFGKKVVSTVKNPIKSAGKALGDIADGARKAFGSAKNIVTGKGNLGDLGNIVTVGVGGAWGAYMIGDAEGVGSSTINNRKSVASNNSTGNNNGSSFSGSGVSFGSKTGGGSSSLVSRNTSSTNKSIFDKKSPGSFNGKTVTNTTTSINNIPTGYLKPKITEIDLKTGLVSSNMDAKSLANNKKYAESNKAMNKFTEAYKLFEKRVKEFEGDKAKIMKQVQQLKKYGPKEAAELEKILKKKEIHEIDFNKYALDQGWITEEVKVEVKTEEKISDPRYEGYSDYLTHVKNVRKENNKNLAKHNKILAENKKIKEENKKIENLNKQDQLKFNELVSKQEKAINQYNSYIKKQRALEETINESIEKGDQKEYDSLKSEFDLYTKKLENTQKDLNLVNNQIKNINLRVEQFNNQKDQENSTFGISNNFNISGIN